MTLRRPAASIVGASLLLVSACTSSGHRGSPSSQPPSPARSFPFASSPNDITGTSPFKSCPPGSGIAADSEVEPSMAVDPRDAHRLLAAWQQDRHSRGGALGIVTASSSDGGATWRQALPPTLTRCTGGRYTLASDPVVSLGPDRAYLSAIGIEVTGSGRDLQTETDVVVSASADHGQTWSDPVVVASSRGNSLVSLDKETLLADARTPGTAYAMWVRYTNPSQQREARTNATYFSRTTDGGRTWSAPALAYEGNTESQFHQLVELSSGTLLDAFIEARSLSDRPPFPARLSVIRSTDGGTTWSHPVTAAHVSFTVVVDPTGKDQVRGTGQGILAAAGPGGAVYLCWSEPRRSADSVVAVVRSDDGGLTWSQPMTVVSERAQPFIPAVAVAGDGTVAVSWYEVPADKDGKELPAVVRFGWSVDRGRTWRFLRLAGPFDLHSADITTGGDFVGDYEGLVGLPAGFAALNAVAKPDSRSGPTDLFFSRVELGP
ncbi:MAG: exo-alpha-sialidase [Actinobacteria bacterium]|nr:MAG: exo-alpha-sialidase [Actinomycetota bacterium]